MRTVRSLHYRDSMVFCPPISQRDSCCHYSQSSIVADRICAWSKRSESPSEVPSLSTFFFQRLNQISLRLPPFFDPGLPPSAVRANPLSLLHEIYSSNFSLMSQAASCPLCDACTEIYLIRRTMLLVSQPSCFRTFTGRASYPHREMPA